MIRLSPKNWSKFQHYKDRNPPWIKLHKELLDDRVFQRLPDASRALAPCLWLLASESRDGVFSGSVEELAFRVRQSEKWVDAALKPLVSSGFIIVAQDASNVLAERLQVAPKSCSETEGETETETETKARFAPPDWIPLESWKGFEQMRTKARKPMTDRARAMIVKELETLKAAGHDPIAVLAQSEVNAWAGVYPIKANGNASIQDWMRSDEGTIRMAEQLGIEARPGEDMRDFRERVRSRRERKVAV